MTLNQRIDEPTRVALEQAWHQDSAAASLERWLDLCEQQGWGQVPENLPLLVSVFGASWYFTRFVFYRGPAIQPLFDDQHADTLSAESIRARVEAIDVEQDPEQALEALRIVKNEIMLQILLADLQQMIGQSSMEQRLTDLAEATLAAALRIYTHHKAPELEDTLGVLGMGRMAGQEMNFGSDLDLIFLYPDESAAVSEQASRLVRALLRGIAMAAPAGSLYDIDMRLRPHGAAGVLVTSQSSFQEYHGEERDIWQRQLMTRCRPVADRGGIASQSLEHVTPHIYAEYDPQYLRQEIHAMRLRVEHELGSPAGRYELKRGKGGVMDIDFISHYLQLSHGIRQPDLRTASTRGALTRLVEHKLLAEADCQLLLEGYDFLKRMEGRLRVFDMKPISSIPREASELTSLARAMGYRNGDDEQSAEALLADYQAVTANNRRVFEAICGG